MLLAILVYVKASISDLFMILADDTLTKQNKTKQEGESCNCFTDQYINKTKR